MALFSADPASGAWKVYLEYVDEMVIEGLFSYIRSSLQFFVDNMESRPCHTPLFEAQFLINSSELTFIPSLDREAGDGLYEVIEGMIGDIFRISGNINRVAGHLDVESYQVLFCTLHGFLLDCFFDFNLTFITV